MFEKCDFICVFRFLSVPSVVLHENFRSVNTEDTERNTQKNFFLDIFFIKPSNDRRVDGDLYDENRRFKLLNLQFRNKARSAGSNSRLPIWKPQRAFWLEA